jgi:ABC-2 type transport system ATP-binding protein
MKIIETKGLTKVYSSSFKKNKVQALIDFNLNVEKGVIFGLLGPNGAGKTTLIKLLLGITFPTSGNASIIEKDISDYKIKEKIGYLPENHKYPPYLKGGEVLRFFGRLSGMNGINLDKKIDELLELVKLIQWKKTKVKAYSKGMMQRLGVAQALINDPELIFLDEPTDGVDPIGRKEIRDILVELKSRQKTIFLNSHLLSEVELITDRVGILNKGKLLREGTVKELTEKKEEYKLVVENAINNIESNNAAYTKQPDGSYIVKVRDTAELNRIIDNVRSKGALLKEIVPLKSTLEEMFISLINESEKSFK